MIAKIIAHGPTRADALARLRRAVGETAVIIEGGATNKSFMLDLLDQPEVIDAQRRHRLDRPGARRGPAGRRPALRHRTGRGRHRGLRGRRARRGAAAAADRARRPSAGAAPRRPADRPQAARPGLPGRGLADRHAALPGHRHRRRRYRPWSTPRSNGSARAGCASPCPARRSGVLTATHGPGALRRGGRRRAPDQPRRGRRAARAGPGPGRGDAGRGRGRGRRRRRGRRARVDEDGDAARRAVRRDRARTARVGGQPGRDRRAAASAWNRSPTRRAEAAAEPDAVDLDLPEGRRRGRAGRARAGAHRPERGRCSASTSTRATTAARSRRYLDVRDAAAARGADVVSGEIGAAEGVRRLRRPEPQPPRRRGDAHRTARAQPEGVLPQLPAEPGRRPQRHARHRSAPSSRRCSRTTASTGSTATPQLEEAVFRIFLAQQRSAPDLAIVTAILQRWHTEPAPGAEVDLAAREVLDRVVLATQLRFPAVGELARSVRFRWYDQPVVAERARGRAGRGARRGRGAGGRPERDPTGPSGWTRSPRSRSASSASWPIGSRTACPRREPLLEVLIRRHYREYALQDLRALQIEAGGRSRSPTTCSTTGRPISSRRSARSPNSTGRQRARAHARASRLPRAVPTSRASSTSTCSGPTRRVIRTSARAALAGDAATDAVRARRAPRRGRRVHRRRTPGRVLHLPSGRDRADRGPARARPAPDGRPAAGSVAAAQLRHQAHRGARGRAALPLHREGQPGRPAAGRDGAGARARGRPRRRRPGQLAAAGRAGHRQLRRGHPARTGRRSPRVPRRWT